MLIKSTNLTHIEIILEFVHSLTNASRGKMWLHRSYKGTYFFSHCAPNVHAANSQNYLQHLLLFKIKQLQGNATLIRKGKAKGYNFGQKLCFSSTAAPLVVRMYTW